MRGSFEHFRIEGILTYNLEGMIKQKPVYQSQKQGTNQKKIKDVCNVKSLFR